LSKARFWSDFVLTVIGIFVASLVVAAVVMYLEETADARHWDVECVCIKGLKFRVYVADSEAKRSEGYKFKNSIDFRGAGAKGMLFLWVLGAPKTVTFTMQNVSFPLLLVHVTYDGRYVVYNKTLMVPNHMYTFTTVSSKDFFLELDPSLDSSIHAGDEVEHSVCYVIRFAGRIPIVEHDWMC